MFVLVSLAEVTKEGYFWLCQSAGVHDQPPSMLLPVYSASLKRADWYKPNLLYSFPTFSIRNGLIDWGLSFVLNAEREGVLSQRLCMKLDQIFQVSANWNMKKLNPQPEEYKEGAPIRYLCYFLFYPWFNSCQISESKLHDSRLSVTQTWDGGFKSLLK